MSPLLLIISILLPVAGGFLILPFRFTDSRKMAVYCEIIAVLTTVLVWTALIAVRREPLTVYSFTHGFSITFRADGMGSLFAGMVSLMWPLVLLYAFDYMRESRRQHVFFAFYVMTYGVALGVAFAANMITLYVFYEMLTLVTIPLVTHYGDRESSYAGRKYAAYTIGGASLAFFAVILTTVWGDAGRFVYGGSLGEECVPWLMKTAFLLGFFGFGAKAAVFPLFDWLPTASVAPTPVTALLHAVAVVNTGVFAVTRMTWYVIGPEMLSGTAVQTVCLAAAVFSLVFAAVMALREKHFKRRLAFSTMSNLSYMLFGVLLLIPEGLAGGLAHMLFHGIIKMSLFLCAGAFMHMTGNSYVYEVNGAGRRMPVTFVCYTLGGLSLTGIPLFCGFISKWQLLTAGVTAGTTAGYAGTAALIAAAFLCAMYTLTVSARAFFPPAGTDRYAAPGPGGRRAGEARPLMLAPILIFSVLNVVLGIFPGPVMDFIRRIAEGLI